MEEDKFNNFNGFRSQIERLFMARNSYELWLKIKK